jgi:hypothetical protein
MEGILISTFSSQYGVIGGLILLGIFVLATIAGAVSDRNRRVRAMAGAGPSLPGDPGGERTEKEKPRRAA